MLGVCNVVSFELAFSLLDSSEAEQDHSSTSKHSPWSKLDEQHLLADTAQGCGIHSKARV
jgi:hypothetical protein